MPGSAKFKVLFFFDNSTISVVEVKITDNLAGNDPGKIYHWLFIDKTTASLHRLNFISMNTSENRQQRSFRQGILHFDDRNADFTVGNQTDSINLVTRDSGDISAVIAREIGEYISRVSG